VGIRAPTYEFAEYLDVVFVVITEYSDWEIYKKNRFIEFMVMEAGKSKNVVLAPGEGLPAGP
jgi:hypothetical protein